jgi:hypothetical protein
MIKGSKHSEESLNKIRLSKTGAKYPNRKKITLTQEHKNNISKSNKGNSCGVTGEKHPRWNPDRNSYFVLHDWVKKQLGKPDTCENCNKSNLYGKSIDWANISGEYKKDISDWARLCKSCHALFDNIGNHLRTSK